MRGRGCRRRTPGTGRRMRVLVGLGAFGAVMAFAAGEVANGLTITVPQTPTVTSPRPDCRIIAPAAATRKDQGSAVIAAVGATNSRCPTSMASGNSKPGSWRRYFSNAISVTKSLRNCGNPRRNILRGRINGISTSL